MDNVFQFQKTTTQKTNADIRATSESRYNNLKEASNSVSSVLFKSKLQEFVKNSDTQSLLDSYRTGAFPLINPALHNHRDRVKQLERDPLGGVTVKNFQLAKDRAEQSRQDFVEAHLERELFDQYQPHKSHAHWLRVRDLYGEGPIVRHKPRTENEEIVGDLKKKFEIIDHAPRNMKMVHNPSWKDPNKQRWMEPTKGFPVAARQTVGSDPSWPQIPFQEGEPFIGGYEETQQNMFRGRSKSKEHNRNEFISKIRSDPWETTLNISTSVRQLKAEEMMHGNQDFQIFSKNHKLDESIYKQSLVATNNVDRIVPFNHSNNFQSLPLKNLAQSYPRNYKNSLVHYGLIKIGPPQLQSTIRSQSQSRIFNNTSGSFLNQINAAYHPKDALTPADSDFPQVSPVNLKNSNQMASFKEPDQTLFDSQKQQTPNNSSLIQIKKLPNLPNKKVFSQSLEKTKRVVPYQPSQIQRVDFRYDPPTDQQVEETINQYFNRTTKQETKKSIKQL